MKHIFFTSLQGSEINSELKTAVSSVNSQVANELRQIEVDRRLDSLRSFVIIAYLSSPSRLNKHIHLVKVIYSLTYGLCPVAAVFALKGKIFVPL